MDDLDAASPSRRRSSRRRKRRRAWFHWEVNWQRWLPVGVFAAMLIVGPLLFGAVDRIVQVLLTGLLAVGVAITPPAWFSWSKGGRWWAIALVAVLLGKELLPAGWFGAVHWREALEVPLPVSHHPEPARVLDAALAAVVAVLWWQWVRTLAADGERRVIMTWCLGGAAVLLAIVCFAMKGNPARPNAIYGWRETQGWVGWGPFPNRNHTSSFLAMGGVCLLGASWWAWLKRQRVLAGAGALGLALVLGALLTGKSRGALLAFGVGLGIFLVLLLCRRRDRQTWLTVAGVLVVAAAVLFTFGGQVLARFRSAEQGTVSNETRLMIWREAAGMWKDAPWLGHGVETFPGIFPLYQQTDLDGKTVLHPESSWMQWLAELGALPVLLLVTGLGWFIWQGGRAAWPQRRIFVLTAGLLAGSLACLAHAVIDVPGHRWATAGYALALLAVAFPLAPATPADAAGGVRRALALVPMAVGLVWALPFLGWSVPWSPLAPTMLLHRQTAAANGASVPTVAEWHRVLRYFPLDPWMRQYAGLRGVMEAPTDRVSWERDLTAARQLLSSAWWISEMQARVLMSRYPLEAISRWQEAIQRGGRQWSEILRHAVVETARLKDARVLWGQYVQARPEAGLVYAQVLRDELRRPESEVGVYFEIWWEDAAGRAVTDEEAGLFYQFAPRWSSPEQLDRWIKTHAGRLSRDYRRWVELLHGWKQDEKAWEIYQQAVPKPEAVEIPVGTTREALEEKVRVAPSNASHALELVRWLERAGDPASARKTLMLAARQADAPPRILREAAYRWAEEGRYPDAVAMALREKPESSH